MASKKQDNLHAALSSNADDNTNAATQSTCEFVHLHVHCAFSLLESALPVKQLIDLAVADNQPALAITDRNNLFGALEFSEKASAAGIQPIMGSKLAVAFEDDNDHVPRSGQIEYPFLVLIACSQKGFASQAPHRLH